MAARVSTATWILGGGVAVLLAVVGWLATELSAVSSELASVKADLAGAEASAMLAPRRVRQGETSDEPSVSDPTDAVSEFPRVRGRFDIAAVEPSLVTFSAARGLSSEDAAAVHDEVASYLRVAREAREEMSRGDVPVADGRRRIREARRGMESALEERIGPDGVFALRSLLGAGSPQ